MSSEFHQETIISKSRKIYVFLCALNCLSHILFHNLSVPIRRTRKKSFSLSDMSQIIYCSLYQKYNKQIKKLFHKLDRMNNFIFVLKLIYV